MESNPHVNRAVARNHRLEHEHFLRLIALCPTIEAEPVKHAKWEIEMDDMGWNKHTCPNCGYVKRTDIHVSLGWNYCPICGAKMDGKENNDG